MTHREKALTCSKCSGLVQEYYGCVNPECRNFFGKDEKVEIVFRQKEVEDILKAIKSRIAFDCNKEIELDICSGYIRSLNIIYKIADDNKLNI